MEQNTQCSVHAEQIKGLYKRVDSVEKRVEKVENEKDYIFSLDKNMAVQTEMLKSIVDHNNKQDERMDKQDKRMDEQHEVIVNINTNLTELAEGQRTLNNRVGKLENKVEENEEKHTIDTRVPDKKKYEDIIYKIILPSGVSVVLILNLIKLFK